MRKLAMVAGAALTLLAAGAGPALAQHHGGWHGGGFHGGGFHGGGWHGGYYRHGYYGGLGYGALGFALGASLASPYYYGSPYYYDDYYDSPAYDCGYWRWDPYWRRNVWINQC